MFKVQDKTTGEIFTVYGLTGNYFLLYNSELDWWFFKKIDECRPVAGGPSREEYMELHITEGDRQ